jgi:hypothetical protein
LPLTNLAALQVADTQYHPPPSPNCVTLKSPTPPPNIPLELYVPACMYVCTSRSYTGSPLALKYVGGGGGGAKAFTPSYIHNIYDLLSNTAPLYAREFRDIDFYTQQTHYQLLLYTIVELKYLPTHGWANTSTPHRCRYCTQTAYCKYLLTAADG